MAEVTYMRNNATPFPVYGVPWTVVFPMMDNDGDLVSAAATLDSEVSLNGWNGAAAFTDCTNEATEIGTSGMYYLTLTGTEMTGDIVVVITKTSTADAKTTPVVLYPKKLASVASGTSASLGAITSSIILAVGSSAIDDFYNTMLCVATIDGNVECRIVSDYVGSTRTCTVVPDWNVAPDSDDTYVLYRVEGQAINRAVDATGAAVAPAATALDSATWTNTKAGYLDASVAAANNGAPPAMITAQEVANALKLAPAAGAPAAGSVNADLDTLTTGVNVSTIGGQTASAAAPVAFPASVGTSTYAGGAVASVTGAVGSVTGLTPAAIADAVCEESVAAHSGVAGSVAALLAALSSAADPWASLLTTVQAYATTTIGRTFADLLAVFNGTTRTITQTAAQVASAVSGGDVTVYRGTTWTVPLTGLGSNTGYSKILWTVKRLDGDADADAIVAWQKSTPGTGDGLTRLNGAAGTPANGAITVVSSTALTATLAASDAANVAPGDYCYGVKVITASGVTLASIGGLWHVLPDIPKAVA